MTSVLEKTAIFKIFSLKKSESQANNIIFSNLTFPNFFCYGAIYCYYSIKLQKKVLYSFIRNKISLFFIFQSCWEKNILFAINLVCRVAFAFEVFPPCNGCRSYFRPCVSCLQQLHYEFQFKIDDIYFLHQTANNISIFTQSQKLTQALNEMWADIIQIQKQPPRGVLKKEYSENIQQHY